MSFEGRERSGSLAHEGDTEAKTSRASESLDALVRSSIYHIPDSACSDLFVLSSIGHLRSHGKRAAMPGLALELDWTAGSHGGAAPPNPASQPQTPQLGYGLR